MSRSPAPRLSVTSTRHADAEDRAALPSACRTHAGPVLVVGQPVLAHACVRRDADRLIVLHAGPTASPVGSLSADQAAAAAAAEMLACAVDGLALAAGHGRVADRRVPAPPRPIPAVSVLPLRDGPGGLHAFVQHRVATMDFAAGAVVFPGGRIDPADLAAGTALTLQAATEADHTTAWRHTESIAGGARTLLATAVREVAEETGARLEPGALVAWDNWVTPARYPKRFDVRFFVYAVPPWQTSEFANTTTEADASRWTPVAELVERTERGELAMLPPTRTIVDELAALGTLADVLALRPRIEPIQHDLTPRRPRPAGDG